MIVFFDRLSVHRQPSQTITHAEGGSLSRLALFTQPLELLGVLVLYLGTLLDKTLCRNPQTGEEIEIAASKIPAFKPGKALKDAIK